MFNIYNENNRKTEIPCTLGNIDCRELVIGLSAILEGEDSFAKFVFAMFDENEDGIWQPKEMENFIQVCPNKDLSPDFIMPKFKELFPD